MKLLNHYSPYPGLNPNVSDSERIISTLAGSYAIFRATQKKKALPEILIGSYLLFRGITGYCGVYNAIGKTKPDNRSRNVFTISGDSWKTFPCSWSIWNW